MSRLRAVVLATLSCSAALGCGAEPAASDSQPSLGGDVFIAFASDFQGFHDWRHFSVSDDAGVGDPAHPDHTLIEYVNRPLAAGSTAFPVGTMIAKEGTSGDPLSRQFFAMVKRGGNFNSDGAAGWEWFELQNLADGSGGVSIVWRGFGPPQGEIYGGNAKAGCNECHRTAPFDSVFAEQARQ